MARRKDEPAVEEVNPIDPEEGDLIDILGQIPGESRSIQIWRMHPQGRPKFLTTLMPMEFSIESLKEVYGGGKYRVTFPVDGVRVERVLEIEGNPKTEIPNGARSNFWGVNGHLSENPPIPANMDIFQQEVIRELRESRKSNGSNELVQILLQLLVNQNKSEDKTLEQLMKYRALFGQSQSSIDANTILNTLKTGLELGGEGIGMGDSKNPWLALAEKIIPMIGAVLNRPPIHPTDFVANGNPAPDNVPQLSESTPMINNNPKTGFAAVADHLKPHLPTFISAAARDVDPQILVDLALPMIPPSQKIVVLDWIKGESWFADLCALSPIIAGQQAWWNDFAGVMIESLTNPDHERTED